MNSHTLFELAGMIVLVVLPGASVVLGIAMDLVFHE